MPSSVDDLLAGPGLIAAGSVPWGDQVDMKHPGVYLVAVSPDTSNREGRTEPAFDHDAIAQWLRDIPELSQDGQPATGIGLASHLAQWWLPNEPVLYVGKATSLAKRVAQYYRTSLGAAKPHKGGYWLKTLADLRTLTVHYATTTDAAHAGAAEDQLLRVFIAGAVPPPGHPEPDLPLPFANLTLDRPPPRECQNNGVTGRDH